MPKDSSRNSETDRPSEQDEREPGEGPTDRIRAFLEERFATSEPEETTEEEPTPLESPLDPDYRLNLINEYRERQREKLEELHDQYEDWYRERDTRPKEESKAPEAPTPPPAENWVPIGPSITSRGQAPDNPGVAGRVARLAITSGATRIYAATANGGVWRSDDGGSTWNPTMEAWDLNPTTPTSDSLSCGAIAIDSADPDRVYVGTGEGDAQLPWQSDVKSMAYFGVGPIRSDDGGQSWHSPEQTSSGPSGLAGQAFYGLAVDPANRERVIAATTDGLYCREPDGGGGFEWDQKQAGIFSSVVAARSGTKTTFYAAKWGGSVIKSNDGSIWKTIGSGFPTSKVGRIGLTVQPSNPNTIYALVSTSDTHDTRGIWRYEAIDDTWRPVSNTFGRGPSQQPLLAGQGWYDLSIVVDPTNVNRVYVGGATAEATSASNQDRWSSALYRCSVTQSGSGSGRSYSLVATRIGADVVHADIHDLVIDPNDNDSLWVASDGGVFFTDSATGSATFEHRNTGLANQTLNDIGQHPSEDAVLFAGSQDQGGVRYTGEEDWLHMAPGDSGFVVVNWANPYKVLVAYPWKPTATANYNSIMRFSDGGSRYNYTEVGLSHQDSSLFYYPLVGTPPNPKSPGEANRVAFGTTRPWVSDQFGGGWKGLSDTGARIKSMAFASHDRLYVGNWSGEVYRYDESSSGWTTTQIDTKGGNNTIANINLPVTDIAVDPADSSGNSIYVTLGGVNTGMIEYDRVWHFNGSQWKPRGGLSAAPSGSLLDVQHNAIAVDPNNTDHIYVGADIGVWESTDGGQTWSVYSEGLPDAAVLDLRIQTDPRHKPLLRASTHGRGVYERLLGAGPQSGVELYVRDTKLDQGRYTTENGLPDPTQPGQSVSHWHGPDIKVDTPDVMGNYQFPPGDISFHQFVDSLTDESRNVPVQVSATLTSRVYVQIHNRGIQTADNVRVMLLLANASAGLPPLPSGYETNVRNGTPINTADWRTVGTVTLDGVEPRVPQVAKFDLPSSMLPPPSTLNGNDHQCVLALVHHADDRYTSTVTDTNQNSRTTRKAAHKNLKVIQFTGSGPSAPIAVPVRFYNPSLEESTLNDLVFELDGYPDSVKVYLPDFEFQDSQGLEPTDDFVDFEMWADSHIEMIETNQMSDHPYDEQWAKERIENIDRVLSAQSGFAIANEEKATLYRVFIEPGAFHTAFLLFDRPEGKIGDAYPIEVCQHDAENNELIGGLTTRVEVVPKPKQYEIEIWTHDWPRNFTVLRARLHDPDGNLLTPEDDAKVELTLGSEESEKHVQMRWHNGWRSFYHFERFDDPSVVSVTARGVVVNEELEVARSRLDSVG